MVIKERLKILFLCTGNSCRSQMAEAWTKKLKGAVIDAYSAGIISKGVDPRAIKAMAEVGVDISEYRSKSTTEFMNIEFDYVITLCDNAQQTCPFFPAKTRILHHGFEDPPVLAAEARSEDEAMNHYRRVRDEIRAFIETLPASLADEVRKTWRWGDSFLAILEAARFVKEHLGVEFEVDSSRVKCEFHTLNKECRKADCGFYPLK